MLVVRGAVCRGPRAPRSPPHASTRRHCSTAWENILTTGDGYSVPWIP